jgi:hypothetical protein
MEIETLGMSASQSFPLPRSTPLFRVCRLRVPDVELRFAPVGCSGFPRLDQNVDMGIAIGSLHGLRDRGSLL